MLQGPHGPFFAALARHLTAAGHVVWRAGFNRADEVFWHDRAHYLPFRAPPEAWPEACAALIDRHAITDLVLYGDTRPIHAQAIKVAHAQGLRVHVFEEGYLRPYWITYERDGANGNSDLMRIDLPAMAAALKGQRPPLAGADAGPPPARWGALRQHVLYGALYHLIVLVANGRYPHFRPHRALGVAAEFRLSLRRLLQLPAHVIRRRRLQARLIRSGLRYHVALLQLDHDASFRSHSPFGSTAAFIELCCSAFAASAPKDEHLVFKAHPLDDDRVPCAQVAAEAARRHGLTGRVHFLPAGQLGALLDGARAAVTVNSTSAQQALWRGLPLKALGRAIYCKPGLVSRQPLTQFFACPDRPDPKAARLLHRYLLQSSQVAGSYYSATGRAQALPRIVALMLAEDGPYGALGRQGLGVDIAHAARA